MTKPSSPTPKLRLMRPGDFHACVQLWRRCEGVVLRDWEDPDTLCTLMARNPGGCWVKWQRAGLGTSLTNQAMNYFSHERIRRVHVLVGTENSHGRAFWRALGATLREDVNVFTMTPLLLPIG